MATVTVTRWQPQLAVDLAQRRILAGFRRVGVHMVRDIKLSLSGKSGGSGGGPPGVRKGRLRRSIEYKIIGSPAGHALQIGSWTVKYALMQEKGGTIVPTHANALAIPIHADAKRARDQGWGPEFPGFVGKLFWIRRKGGKPPMLARQIGGKHARIDIMYILVDHVVIPARPYLRPSLWRNIPLIAGLLAGGTAAKTDVVFATN